MVKLTNTYKVIPIKEQNTNKTLKLDVEEFHRPHAQSLCIFIHGYSLFYAKL
jgi:hypothetical protein